MPIQIWTAEQAAQHDAEIDAEPLPQSLNWALKDAISKWPDFEFTTPDGRRFCIAESGRSIRDRIDARDSYLTPKQSEWLAGRVWGVILDSQDEPIVFENPDALIAAWRELHDLYGVPMSQDEQDYFEVPEEDEDESDQAA